MLHDPSGMGGTEEKSQSKKDSKFKYQWSKGEPATTLELTKPKDDYKMHTPVPESNPKPSTPSSKEFNSPIPIEDERFNLEASFESKGIKKLANVDAKISLSTKDGLTVGASKSGIGVSANSTGVTVSTDNGTVGASVSSDGKYALTKDGNSLVASKESKERIILSSQATPTQPQQSIFVKDATNIKPNFDVTKVPNQSNIQTIDVKENDIADFGVVGYKQTVKSTTVPVQTIIPDNSSFSFVFDGSGNLVRGTYGPKLQATYVETIEAVKLGIGKEVSTTTMNGLNVPSLDRNRSTLNLSLSRNLGVVKGTVGGQINTQWRKGK